MHKLWLILKREYITRVRTRGFILGTFVLPLVAIGFIFFSVLMGSRQTDRTLKIAILDNAGGLAAPIAQGLSEKAPNGKPAFQVLQTYERPEREENIREELQSQVRKGQLDGYLMVPKGALAGKAAEFHTKNPGDLRLSVSIRRAVSDAVVAQRLKDRGISVKDLSNLVRGVDISFVKITEEGEAEEKGQTFVVAFSMVYVLCLTLLLWGVATMRSVLEEKTTRIVEILISSVRPFQLLAGKMLGVAAAGFTQFLIWVVSAGLLGSYGRTMAVALRPGAMMPSLPLPTSLLVYLVVFFLGGYFLYAAQFAAVGAMVSSEEEAQQMQLPVVALTLVGLMLFPVILRNPNSTLSTVLSLIPLFSPTLMFLRIAIQTPPFWQIALSLALVVLATVGVLYLSAKIYRVGMLMYGKRPSLVELLRWLRYS